MANYFELTDIKDEIIKGIITDDHITETNEEIDAIAKSKGVVDIPNPAPYELKKLAIAYGCYVAALYQSGASASNIMGGSDREDVYAKKATHYHKEYLRRKSELSKEDILGQESSTSSFPVIRLSRA